MKLADAPPPGWYPDPQHRDRLRWWEGTDWTERIRPRPNLGELERQKLAAEAGAALRRGDASSAVAAARKAAPELGAVSSRQQTEEIIGEVRQIARSEIDRAIGKVGEQARYATRQVQPLVAEYTNKIFRFLRRAAVVAFILLVAWFVFQAIAQQSFLDWIGDRIDNLTETDTLGAVVRAA